MEFNNCSNTSESVAQYLKHLQDKTNIAILPATIMLSIFAVVGLVGNSLVLIVYSQKFKLNPTKVIIMTIASFDLVANIGAIPSEVNIMFNQWNFSQPGVCKSKVLLGSFTTLGGAISLLVVAIVRYRKVCRPHGWQITIRQAIIASIVTGLLAFLFTIPYMVIYGIKTRKTPCPNIKGFECFADDQYFYTIWPLMNNLLFIVIFLTLSVSMIVLYIMIGITAYKHSKMFVVSRSAKGLVAQLRCENVSSEDNKMNGSNDSQSGAEFTQSSNEKRLKNLRIKRLVRGVRIQTLCCCENKKEDKTSKETPSSSIMKAYTKESAISDGTLEATNPGVNISTTGECLSNLHTGSQQVTTVCSHSTHAGVMINEESMESGVVEMDEMTEEKKSGNPTGQIKDNQFYNASGDDDSGNISGNDSEPRIIKVNHHKKSTRNDKKSKPASRDRKEARRRPLGRMTAMLIIISAIFVFGFFPFLILTIFKNKLPERYANMSMTEQMVYNFFYRLYFLNSAANPIIYSLCDINFRRYKKYDVTSQRQHMPVNENDRLQDRDGPATA